MFFFSGGAIVPKKKKWIFYEGGEKEFCRDGISCHSFQSHKTPHLAIPSGYGVIRAIRKVDTGLFDSPEAISDLRILYFRDLLTSSYDSPLYVAWPLMAYAIRYLVRVVYCRVSPLTYRVSRYHLLTPTWPLRWISLGDTLGYGTGWHGISRYAHSTGTRYQIRSSKDSRPYRTSI